MGADPLLRARLAMDRARVLTLLGCVLLLPPLASVFALDARVLGVPLTLGYLFFVWAVLIVLTWRLAHRMEDDSPPQDVPRQ